MPTQSPTPIPIQIKQNNELPQIAQIQFDSIGILAQGDNNYNNVDINNYQNYSPVNNFTKNNNI
tara:strand:- start:328 stop:519 length:192 start_codon:yes stop_codon:yes gene_type:complete